MQDAVCIFHRENATGAYLTPHIVPSMLRERGAPRASRTSENTELRTLAGRSDRVSPEAAFVTR